MSLISWHLPHSGRIQVYLKGAGYGEQRTPASYFYVVKTSPKVES